MDYQEQPLSLDMALQIHNMQPRHQNMDTSMYMMHQEQDVSFHQEWVALEHVLRHQPSPITISTSMDAIAVPLPSPQSFTTVDTAAFMNESATNLTPEFSAVSMKSTYPEYKDNTQTPINPQSLHEVSPDPTLSEWLMQMQISQPTAALSGSESISQTPSPPLMTLNNDGRMSQEQQLALESCSDIVDSCMPLSMLIGQTSLVPISPALVDSPPSPPVINEQKWHDMLPDQNGPSPSLLPFPDTISNNNNNSNNGNNGGVHDMRSANSYAWTEPTTMAMTMSGQAFDTTTATMPGYMCSVPFPASNGQLASNGLIQEDISPSSIANNNGQPLNSQSKPRNSGKTTSSRSKRSGSNTKTSSSSTPLSPRPLSIRTNIQPSSISAIRSRYMGGVQSSSLSSNRPRSSSTGAATQPRPSLVSFGVESMLKFETFPNRQDNASSSSSSSSSTTTKRSNNKNNSSNTRRRAVTVSNGRSASQEYKTKSLLASILPLPSTQHQHQYYHASSSNGTLTPPSIPCQGPVPVNRSQSDSPTQKDIHEALMLKPQSLAITQSCPVSNRKKSTLTPLIIATTSDGSGSGSSSCKSKLSATLPTKPIERLPLPPLNPLASVEGIGYAPGAGRRSRPSIDLSSVDLDDVTVTTLKRLLRRHGRDTRGKKAELVSRVREEIELAKTTAKRDPLVCNVNDFKSSYNNISIMSAPVSPVTDISMSELMSTSGNGNNHGYNTAAALAMPARRSMDETRPSMLSITPINPITPPLTQSDLGARIMATAVADTTDHVLEDDDPLVKAAIVNCYNGNGNTAVATANTTSTESSWSTQPPMNDWMLHGYKPSTLPHPSSPSNYHSSQTIHDMTNHYTNINESSPSDNSNNNSNSNNNNNNSFNYNYYDSSSHSRFDMNDEDKMYNHNMPSTYGHSTSSPTSNNYNSSYSISVPVSPYEAPNGFTTAPWSYTSSPTSTTRPSGPW